MTTPAVVDKTRREVLTLTSPLLAKIKSLEVRDPAGYALADSLLGRIRDARKQIIARLSEVTTPAKETLDAAKRAYKAATDFRDEMDAPLQDAECTLKAQMKEFKQLELRQTQEEEIRRIEETERLEAELKQKEAQELAARTKAVRERLAKQREELLSRIVETETQPKPTVTAGAYSSTRTAKRWRIKDLDALVRAAADPGSNVPLDALLPNTPAINALFRSHPDEVALWPGVEIYDEVTIVGR